MCVYSCCLCSHVVYSCRCKYKVPTSNTQNILHWLLDYATTHVFQLIRACVSSGYDLDEPLLYYTLYLVEYSECHLATCISTSIHNIYVTINQYFPLIDKRLLSCNIFTSTANSANAALSPSRSDSVCATRIAVEQSYESNLFLLLLLLLNSLCNRDLELDMADDGVSTSTLGSHLIHITLISGTLWWIICGNVYCIIRLCPVECLCV